MPDLQDGQSVEVKGSASRPYTLKNSGGVFSCSCPAWRFQSLPIESRTCRHLRSVRGDAAEAQRVGGNLPARSKETRAVVKAPPLLLAETWNADVNPNGYWMSEKLDGVRAFWDGRQFLSRRGNRYHAPAWFTEALPLEPLDGELWIGRKQFQRTVSIVRRHDEPDSWKDVRFLVFDAPAEENSFEARLHVIDTIMEIYRPVYASAHAHTVCSGRDHLQQHLARIEELGGEGLMLRQPGSRYAAGRSDTLLKVKSFRDAEAVVIGHEAGSGRNKGRLGALLVEMPNGKRFAIGSGLSDAQRKHPPAIGATVTFKYQELTDAGVPRFPTFVGFREEIQTQNLFQKGEVSMATTTKRRFQFVGGTSDKFWECSVGGTEVVVRYGRNGTTGQTETKTFPDTDSATKHSEKKIAEKVKKGYVEVQ
jgi:DNA ligase-1